jgi:hypothetical protein
VRASIVHSVGQVPPVDVGRLVAATIDAPDLSHVQIVDLIAPVPAPTLAQEPQGR